MDNKAMIKLGAAVVIGAVAIWQIISMFGGGDQSAQVASKPQTRPNPEIPKRADLIPKPAASQKAPMTETEIALLKMQQETQAKYIAALEQLQMALVQKDIATANKDIANADRDVMKAKRESVVAQKNILELLSPPKPTLGMEAGGMPATTPAAQAARNAAAAAAGAQATQNEFTVVTVSYTQGKWTAVLAYADKLYSVSVGDALAVDGSTVQTIDRSGVTLDKNGVTRKLTMATVI